MNRRVESELTEALDKYMASVTKAQWVIGASVQVDATCRYIRVSVFHQYPDKVDLKSYLEHEADNSGIRARLTESIELKKLYIEPVQMPVLEKAEAIEWMKRWSENNLN